VLGESPTMATATAKSYLEPRQSRYAGACLVYDVLVFHLS